jgi:hypothetical protein
MSEVDASNSSGEEAQGVAAEAEDEDGGEGEEEAQEDDDEEDELESEEEGEGGDATGGRRRRSDTQDQRSERWRESALYREAQRHAGTPNARKTHRHLGIFGLRGFPAELEHTREFELPEWALPGDDMRLVQDDGADAVSAVPVVGAVAGGGEEPHVGVGAGEGAEEDGEAEVDKEVDQPQLDAVVMAVTVAEDGDKTLLEVGPDKSDSDPMVTVETPKTVDSQETEDLMHFI